MGLNSQAEEMIISSAFGTLTADSVVLFKIKALLHHLLYTDLSFAWLTTRLLSKHWLGVHGKRVYWLLEEVQEINASSFGTLRQECL